MLINLSSDQTNEWMNEYTNKQTNKPYVGVLSDDKCKLIESECN